jgi:hypothetical protein
MTMLAASKASGCPRVTRRDSTQKKKVCSRLGDGDELQQTGGVLAGDGGGERRNKLGKRRRRKLNKNNKLTEVQQCSRASGDQGASRTVSLEVGGLRTRKRGRSSKKKEDERDGRRSRSRSLEIETVGG